MNIKVFARLVDSKAVFDSVHEEELLKIKEEIGSGIYSSTSRIVKINDKDHFQLKKGARLYLTYWNYE